MQISTHEHAGLSNGATSPTGMGVYVHLPWCVRKCPYCDFNSHTAPDGLPEAEYIQALIRDLDIASADVRSRPVTSIYFGGGTPSLFSPDAIARFLEAASRTLVLNDPEITLEANPGTAEAERFRGYAAAGVNRLSLGVQSFDDATLKRIGRIHGGDEALAAVEYTTAAGIDNYNIDLMYAQPEQSLEMMQSDVRTAIACGPTHLSCYQLTIEPNTLFHHNPPQLPDDERAWEMQEELNAMLDAASFRQYEVSAWSLAGRLSRHNSNYWRFGDYIGIGAGAHGKLTIDGRVQRTARRKHPVTWMTAAGTPDALDHDREVETTDLAFEYMLNALRLHEGFALTEFEARTGLPRSAVDEPLTGAALKGLVKISDDRVVPTELGRRFLNDLTGIFL